ncbi:MAG: sulfatase-like hydrolase/transferase, partial [Caldilineaceae bacterium]|nr:sulfatase-like hydrolase/transferase [Caldilineaceae bacterium]
FPWIVRLFPDIKYIHWVRNPRDNILARHMTDDLADFGISYPRAQQFLQEQYPLLAAQVAQEDGTQQAEVHLRLQRAISWQYQYEIVKATPKPAHWLSVRFEDFVLDQQTTLARISDFLEIPLRAIAVRPESVGRYDQATGLSYFDFLDEGMQEFGYTIPRIQARSATPNQSGTQVSPSVDRDATNLKEQTPMATRQSSSRRSARGKRHPNIILFGIDSLRADHMSCYGYERLTTPHIDRFAQEGVLFERNYSPSIPTTPAYASMLTGRDCFGTQVVALRHKGGLREDVPTLAEILREEGYTSTCVGFTGNPSSRGFDKYIDYPGWGSWNEGRSPKAQNLNDVAIPELDRLAKGKEPFFLFLRHMDPHAPYLPPEPYERAFYHGNETDKKNKSMEPVMHFKPFRDFFASWMPPGITDKDYVIAQYDGAIAYMDACIQTIFNALEAKGIEEETLVIINGDHGETLYDHECWFDHHGMYDNVLYVPLIIRYPGKVPAGKRISGYTQHKDLVPTILELAGIEKALEMEGRSLMPMINGEVASHESEFYITECTWMRKHGWRTPQWKLMIALEPDFHFKPEIELYNLIEDPEENNNLADSQPGVVAMLRDRMDAWITKRESETGKPNPMHHQGDWHGHEGVGPFKTSQQAYDTLHIGDPNQAAKLQAKSRD